MDKKLQVPVPESLLWKLKEEAASQKKTLGQWVIDNLRKLVEKGEHGR